MTKSFDLIGKEFYRLTVVARAENSKNGQSRWCCVCACGKEITTLGSSLVNSKTKSCGCLRKEKLGDLRRTHNLSKSQIYNSWRGMKERCDNPNNSHFDIYGGRGISFDHKWSTFNGFYEDMGGSYVEGWELDRIDVNGNYCKDNCRWVDQSEQCYNQRKRKDNSTGRTGVNWHKKNSKWTASIRFDNKSIYLGSFEYFEDAVIARELAELEYYGYNRK